MADIKLGPSGNQTTLPAVCWPSGSAPQLPAGAEGLAEEARMLDGSNRFNIFYYAPETWELVWDGITWANVQTILGVAQLKQELVYTNEYTDNTDHTVVVLSYSYPVKAETLSRTALYAFRLMLKEVTGA